MNSASEKVRSALRDLFRAHLSPHVWLPGLLIAVAGGSIVMLVYSIIHVRPGSEVVPPEILAYRALICWAVSTFCAYVGGFVLGRLYVRD
jgi:hypothetical protein